MLSGAADLKLIMFELIWFCNYGFYFYLVVLLCVAGIAGFSGVDGHGVGDADDFNACDFFHIFVIDVRTILALFIIPSSIFTFCVKMTSAPIVTSFVWLNVISCSYVMTC